ncbi:hypothetical protein AWB78_08014 [Caballeronia calidae]|uniref:Uncharacterized protein n=1 Tax=Caballeronia calidae TaxID=1777139 RepID=A0A158EHR6_9BURK|nr:hypothetical protein AWB78_08014 [Caballeronia calidae]
MKHAGGAWSTPTMPRLLSTTRLTLSSRPNWVTVLPTAANCRSFWRRSRATPGPPPQASPCRCGLPLGGDVRTIARASRRADRGVRTRGQERGEGRCPEAPAMRHDGRQVYLCANSGGLSKAQMAVRTAECLGKERNEGSVVPFGTYAGLIFDILRRFSAAQTSLHSAWALASPRMLNCRNPRTLSQIGSAPFSL